MPVKKLSDKEVKTYYSTFQEMGEFKFYAKLVGAGVMKFATNSKYPDLEFLDIAESFFAANRREEDETLFAIGKVFRRAAHTLNRRLASVRDLNNNKRFLSSVR